GAAPPAGAAPAHPPVRRIFAANAARPESDWLLDALVVASLAGLLVHNFDDTVILLPSLAKQFWLLVGLALSPPRPAAVASAAAAAGDAAGGTAAGETAAGETAAARAPALGLAGGMGTVRR